MAIASKLETINEALGDIKSSIVAKGVAPAGDITTYSTAIDSISGGGDEITATNTTGSAVSSDDRVWVNGEDVYTQNFTIVGSPVINSSTRVLSLPYLGATDTNYIKAPSGFTDTVSSFEMVIKFKIPDKSSVDTSDTRLLLALSSGTYNTYVKTPNLQYRYYLGLDGNYTYPYEFGLGMEVYTGSNNRSRGIISWNRIVENHWYWIKYSYSEGTIYFSYSEDGTNFITTGMEDTSSPMQPNLSQILEFGKFQLGSAMDIDLEETYLDVNGTRFWTPYTKTGTNYSIINDTDITSTSFTGVAQEAIANNASGSIKTLLDGNGTYAPTTATKSITTNGTYTASSENAYGLSSVTVNVPTPDVWYNWKTDVTAISNFTNVNNVIINDYIASGFYTGSSYSANKYLSGTGTFSPQQNDTWEVKIKVKTGSTHNSYEPVFESIYNVGEDGIYVGFGNSGKFNAAVSSDGTNWDIMSFYSTEVAATNTDYWMKLGYDGTKYYFQVSTDGTAFTTLTEVTSSTKVYSNLTDIVIGIRSKNSVSTQSYFYGSVYLDEVECRINGSVAWTPYTFSQSQCYTLTASPTTSTQVYEIPKKTSALTITAVGTGTITLSDTKVYNRNSAGDVESPVLGTKTITSNDTYTAASDYLDGFSSVTVDVPSAPTKKYNLLDRVIDDSNNEIGTVSGFFTDANNVEYAVVCLDAQYRLASGTWCSNSSTIVTDLPTYNNTTWGPWEAKETATFNTQKILDYCTSNGATSTACSHCRTLSFTIDGVSYAGQLPNMIELNDIVRNHTAINTADTTASSYTSLNFDSGRHVWSSSQGFSSSNAWMVVNFGTIATDNKTNSYGVAPVLEIPNT